MKAKTLRNPGILRLITVPPSIEMLELLRIFEHIMLHKETKKLAKILINPKKDKKM